MSTLKIPMALAAVLAVGTLVTNPAQAQTLLVGPPVAIGVAPPIVPVPYPVVTYPRPYVAPPVVAYSTYRPVVTTPVYTPVVRTLPAYIGSGVGGLPRVYVPGQPIRNALRFAIP